MKFGIREIMFMLLLVAIPLGAWWFVFKPRNALIAEANQQIEVKQAKLQAMNKASAKLSDVKADIAEYNKAIDFFQSKLPPEKEMDKVLQEVWKLAEANNLTAKSIRTLKRGSTVTLTDPEGPYSEQPITMDLEGNFKGLYSFLLSLETKARITRIHQLKIAKLPAADEGTMKAQLTMSIFFERNGKKE